jgi:hypothetical protein
VTQPEVEKFQGIVREHLGRISRTSLQTWIAEKNTGNGEDFDLFMGSTITLT